jgi:hypothetical protein
MLKIEASKIVATDLRAVPFGCIAGIALGARRGGLVPVVA